MTRVKRERGRCLGRGREHGSWSDLFVVLIVLEKGVMSGDRIQRRHTIERLTAV